MHIPDVLDSAVLLSRFGPPAHKRVVADIPKVKAILHRQVWEDFEHDGNKGRKRGDK